MLGIISSARVGVESSRAVMDIQVDFFSVRPAKESRELETSVFLLGVMFIVLPTRDDCSGSVGTPVGSVAW